MGPTTGKTVKRKGFTFQNDDGMEGGAAEKTGQHLPLFNHQTTLLLKAILQMKSDISKDISSFKLCQLYFQLWFQIEVESINDHMAKGIEVMYEFY